MSIAERLEALSIPEPNTGCHLWMGALNENGYGRVWHEGGAKQAHRVAFEEANGPVPNGMDVDHRCHMRACVNPAHLEAVSHQENCRRAKARVTHCPHGHDLAKTGYINSRGNRSCHVCAKSRSRQWARKKRLGLLACLALVVLLPIRAEAHEYIHPVTKKKINAGWIMKNPKFSYCCGPQDCEPVSGRVYFTPTGWAVKGLKGRVHMDSTYPSIDGKPWACRYLHGALKGHIRCLFLPRGGQ